MQSAQRRRKASFVDLAEREGLFRTSLYSTAARPAQLAVLFKFVPDKFVEPPVSIVRGFESGPSDQKEGQTLKSVPLFDLAEREGFEPPDPCGSTVFKTAAFDHSATSPVSTSKSQPARSCNPGTRRSPPLYSVHPCTPPLRASVADATPFQIAPGDLVDHSATSPIQASDT